MLVVLAVLCLTPSSNLSAIDLTHVLGGQPINGSAMVLPSNRGDWIFSFLELPNFFRYDIAAGKRAYVGEKLSVATFEGPKIRVKTISQNGISGKGAQLVSGHAGYAKPIVAISRNKLLALSASGGTFPVDKVTKLPKRAFAITIVRLDARGKNPNSDYMLPRDDYGWYEAVDAFSNEVTGVIDVLVAHTLGGSALTRFEAFRIAEGKLAKVHGGRYGKVAGHSVRIWKTAERARGAWPFSAAEVAADPISGSIAFTTDGKVIVDGRSIALPKANCVQYVGGKLYAETRANPDMTTIQKTYQWNPSAGRLSLVGEFAIVGQSQNDKVWVVHNPQTHKFTLTTGH